jgi:hypothetical protein
MKSKTKVQRHVSKETRPTVLSGDIQLVRLLQKLKIQNSKNPKEPYLSALALIQIGIKL